MGACASGENCVMSNSKIDSKNNKEKEEDEEKEKNKKALDRFLKSVRWALVDLTSLEVNSILVSNISADHPSEDIVFLNQTCERLSDWFASESNKTKDAVQQTIDDENLSKLNELCGKDACKDASDKIKTLCDNFGKCIDYKKPDDLDDEQSRKRSEYRRHLRYLNKYLILHDKWCKGTFTDWEHQQLRKLWELVGTRYIYAQTVMQLDGDIILRINEQLFREVEDNAEELMRLHNWNVDTGVNYRNGLINTFVQILRAVTGR